MNYIKRLEMENADKAATIDRIRTHLQALERYLCSSKFRCGDTLDGYVNIQDVLTRLPVILPQE